MFGWRLAAILIAAIAASSAASARPLPIEYKGVSVSTAPNARIPLSATVRDEAGDTRVLGALLGEPTVLVFADFTCRTLCGPAVAFVAAALERSGLRAKEQLDATLQAAVCSSEPTLNRDSLLKEFKKGGATTAASRM